ncbi:MAG: hypothetical protein J6I42_00475, partial [Clostridia bacterium]|nr:hypothetical protein [Clostridia bacterium]
RLFLLNDRFGQICTQTLSLPKNLNAGKPLSVRAQGGESPERFPSQQFTKGRRLSPFVRRPAQGHKIEK